MHYVVKCCKLYFLIIIKLYEIFPQARNAVVKAHSNCVEEVEKREEETASEVILITLSYANCPGTKTK